MQHDLISLVIINKSSQVTISVRLRTKRVVIVTAKKEKKVGLG